MKFFKTRADLDEANARIDVLKANLSVVSKHLSYTKQENERLQNENDGLRDLLRRAHIRNPLTGRIGKAGVLPKAPSA